QVLSMKARILNCPSEISSACCVKNCFASSSDHGGHHAGASSLEYGHHVYAAPWRVYVPGGGEGLVQSVWAVVGGVDDDGRGFLSGGVGSSSRGSSTRHLSQ